MNFYHPQKQYACGVDLHSKDSYICITDKEKNILTHRKIGNRHTDIWLKILHQYKDDIVVAAESTFAWYWLADLCDQNNIEFILGHALYMKAIHGGKAQNDRIDSKKIALLVTSGMFPVAYVYPKEKRSLRDLLRRRLRFVRIRSELLGHVQLLNYQENLPPLGRLSSLCKKSKTLTQRFQDRENKKSAEYDLALAAMFHQRIDQLERHILAQARNLHQKELLL